MTDRPPVRMIATDLDGTLLRTDGSLSDRVLAALRQADELGVEVVPATGRPRLIATDVIDQLPFVHHWVFANGSVTWHLGRSELIRGFWLQPDEALDIVSRLRRQLPGAGFAIELDDTVAFEPGFEHVVPTTPANVAPVERIETSIERRVQKVLVFDLSKSIEMLYAEVNEALGTDVVPSYSGLSFIELAAALVTKASAVAALAADLGIERDEVVAFGDNHNDVALLEWAGWSYAMANASEDAKIAADEIIGHADDDAVATTIEALLQ